MEQCISKGGETTRAGTDALPEPMAMMQFYELANVFLLVMLNAVFLPDGARNSISSSLHRCRCPRYSMQVAASGLSRRYDEPGGIDKMAKRTASDQV